MRTLVILLLILCWFVGDIYTSAGIYCYIRHRQGIGIRDKQGADAVVVDGQFLNPLPVDFLSLIDLNVIDQLVYHTALAESVVNWYAMYVNRFLFETIHQEFNPSQVKLCNLLYLLTMNQPSNSGLVIEMTQEDIADILGMSRVQITRELTDLRSRGILSTTRGRLTVTDLPTLASLCTDETM